MRKHTHNFHILLSNTSIPSLQPVGMFFRPLMYVEIAQTTIELRNDHFSLAWGGPTCQLQLGHPKIRFND